MEGGVARWPRLIPPGHPSNTSPLCPHPLIIGFETDANGNSILDSETEENGNIIS